MKLFSGFPTAYLFEPGYALACGLPLKNVRLGHHKRKVSRETYFCFRMKFFSGFLTAYLFELAYAAVCGLLLEIHFKRLEVRFFPY